MRIPRPGPEALGAIGVALLFIAITCWWLSQDDSFQSLDAGWHLMTILDWRDRLATGDLLGALSHDTSYPPLTRLVGALGALAGGANVTAPIVAQNVVFVPLLALGCYQAGKLAYGPGAGLLAVVFALGAPLVVEQFHVAMLDAPLAAMVALSVWLILRTDRFGRLGASAVAGLGIGLGLSTKQQYLLFVYGIVLVVILRGGWRNWRGILACGGVAFAVSFPWYAMQIEHFDQFVRAAGTSGVTIPPRSLPRTWSTENLLWYFWAVLNTLLFAPLFLMAMWGVAAEVRAALAKRVTRSFARGSPVGLELLGGLGLSWLAISLQPHHDIRYALPLIVYLAVLGTGWVVRLRPSLRAYATGWLVLAACAATAGAAFGLGARVEAVAGSQPIRSETMMGTARPNAIVLYATSNYIRDAPRQDGDMLGLMRALEASRDNVGWLGEQWPAPLDSEGLHAFARLAEIEVAQTWERTTPNTAQLVRGTEAAPGGVSAPCLVLGDGSAVWIRLGTFDGPEYCPWRRGG